MPISNERHEYRVNLSRTGDRVASLEASGISETIEVATPPEFPGGVEGVWSPEHLFTASVVSCFFTTFEAIAEYSKFDFVDLKVESSGVMEKMDGKFVMSKVLLKAVLTIKDETGEKKGHRLLEKAEQICLITRSVKTEVHLEPTVVIEEAGE